MKAQPKAVDAVQWFPGVEIEGMTVTPLAPCVVFSLNRQLFYVDPGSYQRRPDFWLEVAEQPGDLTPEQQAEGFGKPGYIVYTPKDGGAKSHRKVLHFAWWKVPTERPAVTEPMRDHMKLAEHYAGAAGWPEPPETYKARARVEWPDTEPRAYNNHGAVDEGGWVVRHPDGRVEVLTDETFRARFDEVE